VLGLSGGTPRATFRPACARETTVIQNFRAS
jgi:hypothetical protein